MATVSAYALDAHATLVCRVRSMLVAVPLAHVVEVMRPLATSPVAAMPVWLVGLAVIRGRPTPVVDAGALLASAVVPLWSRFVALRAGDRSVALAVEAVIGVRALAPAVLQDLPGLLGGASAELVTAVGTLDDELLIVLNAARVIPDSLWRSLDETRAV